MFKLGKSGHGKADERWALLLTIGLTVQCGILALSFCNESKRDVEEWYVFQRHMLTYSGGALILSEEDETVNLPGEDRLYSRVGEKVVAV